MNFSPAKVEQQVGSPYVLTVFFDGPYTAISLLQYAQEVQSPTFRLLLPKSKLKLGLQTAGLDPQQAIAVQSFAGRLQGYKL
jgi:hypothetical protein